MFCFLCGKKIDLFRRILDREYCCAAHRYQARLVSARALRDSEYEDEEPWPVLMRAKKAPRAAASPNQAASALALTTVGLLILAALSVPNSGPSEAAAPPAGPHAGGRFQLLTGNIANILRSTAPVTVRDDFRSGLAGWTGGISEKIARGERTVDGWSGGPGFLQPGKLRLWNRSTKLVDYEMEFSGEIDNKSLNWAFRALDAHNYYATKLMILRPGTAPNAGLVRYAMLGGHEFDRMQLPLPLTLERRVPYRVRVSVIGDRFVTSVNGQVISSWTDTRLHRGGIGFFSDDGELSTLYWVSVSERDSMLGRLVAHFSLIALPAPQE
ncbi:MAG TPA: hypothetical protein VKV15_24375 [Bryobacteraceae bacterium]|nr:hypothetical protein [Bryobacteraceae bacterium]